MTSHFDAVVIGAGPAGLSAGASLGEMGLNVMVLDEQDRPRVGVPQGEADKARAELLAGQKAVGRGQLAQDAQHAVHELGAAAGALVGDQVGEPALLEGHAHAALDGVERDLDLLGATLHVEAVLLAGVDAHPAADAPVQVDAGLEAALAFAWDPRGLH